MARTEIELNPVDFITVGTIGPKGRRVFHLQAGQEGRIVTFTIEKEQARILSETIGEFLDELDSRYDEETRVEMAALDMDLREPIEPLFRVMQIGLMFDEISRQVILVVQEFSSEEEDESDVVRMWCSREQLYALSIQAMDMVEAGRPSPTQNGRIRYYWT